MIPSLPLDLLQIILENVDDKQSLARCCSTSKIMLALARPHLYHTISVLVRVRVSCIQDSTGDPNDSNDSFMRLIPEMMDTSESLLQSLANHATLKELDRGFTFVSASREDKRDFSPINNAITVFRRVCALIPDAKDITVVDPDDLDKIDTFLHDMQRDYPSSALVHLTILETKYYNLAWLRARYISLEIREELARSPYLDDPGFGAWRFAEPLVSLRLESSDDFGRFTLGSFSSLERLELVSAHSDRSGGIGLQRTDQTLSSLRDLKSLETLVLSGCPCETSEYLFTPGRLGESIPPCVGTLDIDIGVGIATLLELISSLPLSTGIKKFVVRTRIEDVTELKEICQGKGIKLVVV